MNTIKTITLSVVSAGIGAFGYFILDDVLTPPAVVIEAAQGETLLTGTFMDADPAHVAGGSFMIVSDGNGGRSINLNSGFNIVHAPDPHVVINGQIISKVVNYEGVQSYPIPNLISADITTVTIYCKIAGIDLAKSTLQ